MSNPQQVSDQRGCRKSKRQRVPNQYYTAGINQLKKITLKAQSKKNRTDEEDDYSEQDDRNMSNNYRSYPQTYNQKPEAVSQWLTCILPNSRKPMKVQIVIDSNISPIQQYEAPKQKEEPVRQQMISESQPIFAQSYNSGPLSKKSESQGGGLNLLSLFEKVIKNVSDEVPSPVKPINIIASKDQDELGSKYQASNQKPALKTPVLAPPPKRIIEEDKDGKILSVNVDRQNKLMLINHSKIGSCQVPIEVQPNSWNIKEEGAEEDLETIEQFKSKILMNPSILNNIPIFN